LSKGWQLERTVSPFLFVQVKFSKKNEKYSFLAEFLLPGSGFLPLMGGTEVMLLTPKKGGV